MSKTTARGRPRRRRRNRMTALEIVRRKITLKRQAHQLLRADLEKIEKDLVALHLAEILLEEQGPLKKAPEAC